MTEDEHRSEHRDEHEGRGDTGEQVGSVAEETARLVDALRDWAGSGVGGAAGAGSVLGARLSEIDEHLATESHECTYCPLCRGIALLRQTSPEVRSHLAVAARSLLEAGTALLETRVTREDGPDTPLQHIDLDEDPKPD